MVYTESVQIIVAGDYSVRTGAEGTRKHRCVIGIAKFRFFDGYGLDSFGEFAIARDNLCGRKIFFLEFSGEFGAPKDAGKFGNQLFGGDQLKQAVAGRFDQSLGGSTPNKGGYDHVSVKNDAHGPREVQRVPISIRIRVRIR